MSDVSTATQTSGENLLPAAVRRQAERANDIARSAGTANVPGVAAIDNTGPVVEPAAAPAEPVAPVQQELPLPENFEQRYLTLQGKYSSETAALRAQIAGLQQVLAATQAPRPEPVAPPAAQVAAPEDPKDVEEFGPDLIAAARRWARQELAGEIAELRTEIATTRTTATTVQNNQAQQTVMTVLDNDSELGDKWRVINDSPEFVTWLQQTDPFTGHQRVLILRDAYSSGDARRTSAFFKAFLAEHTVVNLAPGGPAAHTPAANPAPGAGGPTLESLAAPGRGSGPTSGGAPDGKRVWTNQSIAAFYRDVNKGAYASREVEKQRLETDIFAAAAEGRVH